MQKGAGASAMPQPLVDLKAAVSFEPDSVDPACSVWIWRSRPEPGTLRAGASVPLIDFGSTETCGLRRRSLSNAYRSTHHSCTFPVMLLALGLYPCSRLFQHTRVMRK